MGLSLSVPFLGSVCVLQTLGAAAALMLKATSYAPTGIICDPPPDIPHGRHSGQLMDTFSYADVVTYTCDAGHPLAGEPSIFCTTVDGEHGVWSGPPPQCGGRARPSPPARLRAGQGAHSVVLWSIGCSQDRRDRGTTVPSSPLLQEAFGTCWG